MLNFESTGKNPYQSVVSPVEIIGLDANSDFNNTVN